ncbi:exported hypothetical protein [Candidatus Magnetomoraceae bacterium gMMP-1]
MKKKSLFMLLLIVLFSNAAFAEFQTNSMKVFRDLTVFGAATVKGPATITGTVKLADESLQISNPATGENTCTASSPTGWNCSYWVNSSSTITAYVICQ